MRPRSWEWIRSSLELPKVPEENEISKKRRFSSKTHLSSLQHLFGHIAEIHHGSQMQRRLFAHPNAFEQLQLLGFVVDRSQKHGNAFDRSAQHRVMQTRCAHVVFAFQRIQARKRNQIGHCTNMTAQTRQMQQVIARRSSPRKSLKRNVPTTKHP